MWMFYSSKNVQGTTWLHLLWSYCEWSHEHERCQSQCPYPIVYTIFGLCQKVITTCQITIQDLIELQINSFSSSSTHEEFAQRLATLDDTIDEQCYVRKDMHIYIWKALIFHSTYMCIICVLDTWHSCAKTWTQKKTIFTWFSLSNCVMGSIWCSKWVPSFKKILPHKFINSLHSSHLTPILFWIVGW